MSQDIRMGINSSNMRPFGTARMKGVSVISNKYLVFAGAASMYFVVIMLFGGVENLLKYQEEELCLMYLLIKL